MRKIVLCLARLWSIGWSGASGATAGWTLDVGRWTGRRVFGGRGRHAPVPPGASTSTVARGPAKTSNVQRPTSNGLRRLLATVSLLPVLLASCAAEADSEGIRVVATTGMVADLARVVGGERVHVDALMGPGIDPHLYQAAPSDLKKLRAASLVLYNGKGLEGKMADVFVKLASKIKVVAVTEQIDDDALIRADDGHWDPHVWFDVALWSRCAVVVGDALAEVDPNNASEYRKSAQKYASRLKDELDPWVRSELSKIPEERRVLVTSHDAFRYLGRAYGMEVRGVQGISTASLAGVKDVEQIVEMIIERKVKAIFVESSVAPKTIEAVQERVRKAGHEVSIGGELFSDAMGDEPPADTYVGMVEHNVKTLVEALQ